MSSLNDNSWRHSFEDDLDNRWEQWQASHPDLSIDTKTEEAQIDCEGTDDEIRKIWEGDASNRKAISLVAKEHNTDLFQLQQDIGTACAILEKIFKNGGLYHDQLLSEVPVMLTDRYNSTIQRVIEPSEGHAAARTIRFLSRHFPLGSGMTFEEFHGQVSDRFLRPIAELNVEHTLRDMGFDPELFPAGPLQRLEFIEEYTNFNRDCKKIMIGCERIANVWRTVMAGTPASLNLGIQEMHNLRLASVMHDIGKTGTSRLPLRSQKAVTRLYAVQGVRNAEHTSVRTVMETSMEWDSRDEKVDTLKAMERAGIDTAQPIRKFYDQHGPWSVDVLKEYPEIFNEQIIEVIAAHHADRDGSPYRKDWWDKRLQEKDVSDTPECRQIFMARLLMVMDKYEAALLRKHRETGVRLTHHEAVAAVEQLLKPKFQDDYFCTKILDMIKAGGPEWLFEKDFVQFQPQKRMVA